MADFPRVRVNIESRENPLDAAMVSRSRAGRIRVRRLYEATTREFKVSLKGLTDTERDAVENFLIENRAEVFNLYWPRKGQWLQVVWTDSSISWEDQGNRLSATDITLALA